MIPSIKSRQDFINIRNKGISASAKSFHLQVIENKNNEGKIRLGITASKKIGNAVIRNRVKRRLRHLSKEILSKNAKKDFDYVLIAKFYAIDRPYSMMAKDLNYLLHATNTFIKT